MRDQVRSTALRLFAEQGYDTTTTAQIARESEVSPSSFFRYFGTKEDVLFDHDDGEAERLRAALSERPADESVWHALRATLRVRTAYWMSDPARSRLVLALWASSPALQAHQRAVADSWRLELVDEVHRRLARTGPGSRLRAATVVGTVFACLDVALTEWQRQEDGGTGPSLDDLFDLALSVICS